MSILYYVLLLYRYGSSQLIRIFRYENRNFVIAAYLHPKVISSLRFAWFFSGGIRRTHSRHYLGAVLRFISTTFRIILHLNYGTNATSAASFIFLIYDSSEEIFIIAVNFKSGHWVRQQLKIAAKRVNGYCQNSTQSSGASSYYCPNNLNSNR